MTSLVPPSPYSGVKRDRGKTLPTTPTFGDLPPPPRPTSAFQKKLIFNWSPFKIKQEFVDEPCSPAPKLIKRECNTETNTFSQISIRKHSGSEGSSSSESSPTSSTSSATSTSVGGGQQVLGKNNHQSAFAPKTITPPKAFNFNEFCNSPKITNNIPSLFSFEINDNLPPPFCYNCKTFGHLKIQCFNRWYSWWPTEYVNRYHWLRRKLNNANQLRRQGMMDRYMKACKKIEHEVEVEDRKRQHNFTHYRTGPYQPPQRQNNNYGRYWGPAKGRQDGQKILHAIRRVKPPTPPAAGCPTQHKFNFDCHKLIEDLQRQVNQLKFTLTNIKSASVSPPNKNRFTKLKSLS